MSDRPGKVVLAAHGVCVSLPTAGPSVYKSLGETPENATPTHCNGLTPVRGFIVRRGPEIGLESRSDAIARYLDGEFVQPQEPRAVHRGRGRAISGRIVYERDRSQSFNVPRTERALGAAGGWKLCGTRPTTST